MATRKSLSFSALGSWQISRNLAGFPIFRILSAGLVILRSVKVGAISPVHCVVNELDAAVPQAAIHQFDGTIRMPARKGMIFRKRNALGKVGRRFVKKEDADTATQIQIPAYNIRIPARPFVGLTAGDEDGILEDARDWLSR